MTSPSADLICSNCNEKKGLDEFYVAKNRSDSWCKACRKLARKNGYKYVKKADHFENFLKLSSFTIRFENRQLSMVYNRLKEIVDHGRNKECGGIQPRIQR